MGDKLSTSELSQDLCSLLRNAHYLFEHSFDAVLITTYDVDDPRILYSNPAHKEMSGYDKEDLLHQSPKIFQGPKTNKKILKRLRECLQRSEPFIGAAINYRKDGSEYHVEWKITPILDQQGNGIAYLSIQRDLTFLKHFLSRLVRSTTTFRAFINEFMDESQGPRSRDKLRQMAGQFAREGVSNMSLFSSDLRSREDKVIFGDELFSLGQKDMGVMPVHQAKTKISAREYLSANQALLDDAQHIGDILADMFTHIEFANLGQNVDSSMKMVLKELQEFANIIFYIDEFIDISTVLGQLVVNVSKSPELFNEQFLITTLHSLIVDLNQWYRNIFIEQTASDIHELDASILSSAKQIIFMIDG
ncbi:PAS domain-containing protein [Pseudoalteromonas sp. SSDWG2]|uniref:PAS domain-containing protein n=1 Tax=Pseudoalteromonas sp. SSDWG2 TaxID=3139391 RepID=UPI003BA95FEB